MKTAKQILIDAADLLERVGWCQGVLAIGTDNMPADPESPNACKFCMIGAIERVSENGEGAFEAQALVGEYIAETVDTPGGSSVSAYNDGKYRTAQHCIDMLRGAAK